MTRTALLAAAAAIALPAAALPGAAMAEAQSLYMDPSHTQIIAEWRHFARVPLAIIFTDYDASITYDSEDISNSSVDITIPVDSIWTGVDGFTAHLLNPDFFESETWPTARFVSTSITRTGDNTAELTGDLTIKDNTAPVTFDVELLEDMDHPMSGARLVGFVATTTLDRTEWGLGLFAPVVPAEVELTIATELVDTPPAQ